MLEEQKRPVDIEPIPEQAKPTRTTRVINKFILLALVLIAVSLGIFLKWSFEDTNILEVKNSPFPARIVADPSGQTGGIAFLYAEYCKNSDKEGTLRMSYVSVNREIFLPIQSEKIEKGCDEGEVPVVIPKDLTPDKYKIKFRATYDVNPVKRGVIVEFESQEFTVDTANN